MIDKKILQEKVLKNIPILKSMQICVESIERSSAIISVPLGPNHNHKGTAFGGSLYSACTAASYVLLYALQIESNLENRDLVITKGEIKYLKPVNGDFFVQAMVEESAWLELVESLNQGKPKRLQIRCVIYQNLEKVLDEFSGEFAFLPAARA